MANQIQGNAGVAGATISYAGAASGSVVADNLGQFAIQGLAAGAYTLTPSLAGFTFSPANTIKTIVASDILGVIFTATDGNSAFSETDSRSAGANSTIEVQGTQDYVVPSAQSHSQPVNSDAVVPKDSRTAATSPVNSRAIPH